MTVATEAPRVYIASLTDYNCGRLHGVFITLDEDLDLDGFNARVQAMLARSPSFANGDTSGCPAEEWALHDYEGFGDLHLSEYVSWQRLLDLAAAIREHGAEVVAGYLNNVGTDSDLDGIAEAYCGHYESETAYAEGLVGDCGGLQWFGRVPDLYSDEDRAVLRALWENVETYIDFGAVARDLFSGGHWSCKAGEPDYGIHVFRDI